MIERKEDAVSPVVGVMLMLVVTIIIAAVVSGFAGGLASGKEKAPQVSLETHIQLNGGMMGGTQMIIKHLGGDPINTKNVKLVTSWVNESGVYHMQSTVGPKYVDDVEMYYDNGNGTTTSAHYALSSLNTHYSSSYQPGSQIYYNEPYLVIPGTMPASENNSTSTPLWFGNYILRAGDVIKADQNLYRVMGVEWEGMADYNQAVPVIKDVELLTGNEVVNVKLIDLKSGSTIYDKDVIVEV
jgi:FlaG/FlaF family flagellin (archaellin)